MAPSTSGLRTLAAAAVLTIATSSQGLLTTASKTEGQYLYNFATVPFLAEACKLGVSLFLLSSQIQADPSKVQMTRDWRTIMLFPVPSLIYLVHNNVQFSTLQYVDPSTYQIMGNLKIVTTGLLFRLILRRQLSKLQWIALLLLTVGATTSQVAGCGDSALSAPMEGYALGVLSACLSALAGVYTEYVMKRVDDNLYWQNVQLYGFGVLFNGARLVMDDVNAGFHNGFSLFPSVMLQGYDGVTFLVVLNLAFTGLLVSWIMKFADSIVKVYSTSMAMVVTMALSVFIFGIAPTLQMTLGIITASCSLLLYYMSPADLSPEAAKQAPAAASNVRVDLPDPEEKNAED